MYKNYPEKLIDDEDTKTFVNRMELLEYPSADNIVGKLREVEGNLEYFKEKTRRVMWKNLSKFLLNHYEYSFEWTPIIHCCTERSISSKTTNNMANEVFEEIIRELNESSN